MRSRFVGIFAMILSLALIIIGCSEQAENPVADSQEDAGVTYLKPDTRITLEEIAQPKNHSDGSQIKAAPVKGETMIKPIWGQFSVTREFGEWLYIPGMGWDEHTGIDIAPRSSSAWYVFAPADGLVIDTGYGKWEGNYVVIRHSRVVWNRYRNYTVRRIYTKYYHLAGIYSWVRPGNIIHQGWAVGRVGSTGKATTGAHLHFEIRENSRYGKAVNSREYILFRDGKDLPLYQ